MFHGQGRFFKRRTASAPYKGIGNGSKQGKEKKFVFFACFFRVLVKEPLAAGGVP